MQNNKKLQTIYIRMIEGVETFIPVSARCIGDNTFEIISNKDMDLEQDATSIYEFFPGDIVKCKLKPNAFSPENEKHEEILLAQQLLISSPLFPSRRVYQFIFNLVENFGNLEKDQLNLFKEEIKLLCKSDCRIKQKEHPIVEKWLSQNGELCGRS